MLPIVRDMRSVIEILLAISLVFAAGAFVVAAKSRGWRRQAGVTVGMATLVAAGAAIWGLIELHP